MPNYMNGKTSRLSSPINRKTSLPTGMHQERKSRNVHVSFASPYHMSLNDAGDFSLTETAIYSRAKAAAAPTATTAISLSKVMREAAPLKAAGVGVVMVPLVVATGLMLAETC